MKNLHDFVIAPHSDGWRGIGYHPGTDQLTVDAWERMTYGGINGRDAGSYAKWTWTVGRGLAYKAWMDSPGDPDAVR